MTVAFKSLRKKVRRHKEAAHNLRAGEYGVVDSFCRTCNLKVWVGSSLADDLVRDGGGK